MNSMKRRGGAKNYCRFNGCGNTDLVKGIHLYRFPKENTRCQVWVKAAQNPRLYHVPSTRLHENACLCNFHFQDWCFMNIDSKTRLVHNAIPCSPKPPVPPRVVADEVQVSTVSSIPNQSLHDKTDVDHSGKSLKEIELTERRAEPESTTASPSLPNLSTVSTITDSNPDKQPLQRPILTFIPVIGKVAPPQSKSQSKEDEELDLYLKLLGNKLRQYRSLERRQIMHEIDGIFLRITPSLPSSSTSPQFVIASFKQAAFSSQAKASSIVKN